MSVQRAPCDNVIEEFCLFPENCIRNLYHTDELYELKDRRGYSLLFKYKLISLKSIYKLW